MHTLFISHGADKENLFNNQEPLKLVTIFFILVNLLFDLGVLLKGEIRDLISPRLSHTRPCLSSLESGLDLT